MVVVVDNGVVRTPRVRRPRPRLRRRHAIDELRDFRRRERDVRR